MLGICRSVQVLRNGALFSAFVHSSVGQQFAMFKEAKRTITLLVHLCALCMPDKQTPLPPQTKRPAEIEEPEEEEYHSTWWRDSGQSLVRLLLNIFAAGMIAKGYGDQAYWDQVIAAGLIIFNILWAVRHQKKRRQRLQREDVTEQDQPSPNKGQETINNEPNTPEI